MAHKRFNLNQFIDRHRLPRAFTETAERVYMPLAHWLEAQLVSRGHPGFVLGVNGAQGTGKSTLSNFLAGYLGAEFGRRVAEVSIDDIYLTRAEREALGRNIHPLLVTRGVPGTHDVAMGRSLLNDLAILGANESMSVPRFDKAIDDRHAQEDWSRIEGPVDLVIFEGWCVGAPAEPDASLEDPINALEAQEDPTGAWRAYVNNQLVEHYPALFETLDALVYLAIPDFDAVLRWRTEQEAKLRARTVGNTHCVMDDAEIARFIQHFERVTRASAGHLARTADAVVPLDDHHRATGLAFKSNSTAKRDMP